MFSQFINVVEGLAQPRLPHSPRRSDSVERASPPNPSAGRPAKNKLEDRLRASFTIGDVSNPSTPPASSRVSPAPQFVAEHPLSIEHPLSPAAISLPTSPPPNGLDSDSEPLPLGAPLSLPDPLSVVLSDAPEKPVSLDPRLNSDIEPESTDPSSPSNSLPPHSPTSSQVSEQSLAASEEDTREYDATQSASTPGASHHEDDEGSNAPVVETSHADQHESGEIPIPGHSASADVESLQEQLRLMEKRFADISASFAMLQAEKVAADRVLQEMTSLSGCHDADGLRDYLQNAQLKVEMLQDEARRLTGKLTRQDERIEELREIHRLESVSQTELVDELRSQIQQNEALLKAARTFNSQLEADVAKGRTETDQLRTEAEKLSGLAKDEEEKRNKAVSLLKTVRQKLVKAEKEREDALKEAAAVKEGRKTEHDKEQLEREKLQGELNKLKVEKEVSLADLRAQFEKDLMASKQRSERETAALRGQFELEIVTAKSSHEHSMNLKDAQIDRLERATQSLSAEKDHLFDQLQMRQAEVESAQSLLEVLQGQNTELQYQVREKDGRIALLNEELSDSHQEQQFGTPDPSTSPEEVAKLLAAAEARHETKLSVLKHKLASMEAERVEVEAEWRQKVEAKVQEAQRWKSVVDTASQSQQDDDDRMQGLQVEVERLRSAARTRDHEVSQLRAQIDRLTHDEESIRLQIAEQVKKISTLDHQLEETAAKELQVRAHNKTLREELRKVQSSAALLDRQRGPGVGYWGSTSAPDVNAPLSPVSPRPPGASRPESPITKSNDEDVNLEYLRNVILQFLEHKEMRPDLVRVLSTILRFTPQETRRLVAKV